MVATVSNERHTGAAITPDWIALDCGAAEWRAWALSDQGDILAEARRALPDPALALEDWQAVLSDFLAPWLGSGPTEVVACGQISATDGVAATECDAGHRAVPCPPLAASSLRAVPLQDPRLHLRVVPGLSQAKPADLLCGQETQIAGALALHPEFDGVLCLPGATSTWVHVSAGEVISFQSFLTGEMFDLLANHSSLRHGLALADPAALASDAGEDTGFDTALSEALSRPERMAAKLFALRAEWLLQGLAPAQARARLSGLLIGIELAAAKPYWLGQNLLLIAPPALARPYGRALTAQGLAPRSLDAGACTLAGLVTLRRAA